MKTKLSVNINKVALIRNSRGSNIPDIIQFARDCESCGADGITVHPRPDQRHVRYDDLPLLKENVTTELNVEGYPSEEFMRQVIDVVPHQCTLVPDPPGVLTSDKGWEIIKEADFLTKVISQLQQFGIRVSLFIDPDPKQVRAAVEVGADRIELYTGDFAKGFKKSRDQAIADHIECAKLARQFKLGVNAGHDLNLDNLKFYASSLDNLSEVSIGHALISDALYYGIDNTIGMYKNLL